jgi:hypothetical protein
MGLSAQQMLQNDPEYLARQMAQQEITKYQNFQNPQLGLAATSGALIGRGIGNLFSGRGFFDIGDPALRKVAEVQSLYNQAMQGFDPANPGSSYEQLATKLAQAGHGPQAALAAAEAYKYRQQERDFGLRERGVDIQERGVSVQEGTLEVSKDKLKKDLDDAKRLERLTDAQIKKIDAEIANLGGDRYSFNLSKDALGNLVEIIAVNKSNPSDMKRIKISEPATSAAADPAAAARAELERRRKGKTSTMSTPSVPELDAGVSP